jgi:hypothetical protein
MNSSDLFLSGEAAAVVPPDLVRTGCCSLLSGLIARVRFCFLWYVVGMVEAAFMLINLHQLYSHTDDNLMGGA